jgi:hypothetical protein
LILSNAALAAKFSPIYTQSTVYLTAINSPRSTPVKSGISDIVIESGKIKGSFIWDNWSYTYYDSRHNDIITYSITDSIPFEIPYVSPRPRIYLGDLVWTYYLDNTYINLHSEQYSPDASLPLLVSVKASLIGNTFKFTAILSQQCGYSYWNDHYSYTSIYGQIESVCFAQPVPEVSGITVLSFLMLFMLLIGRNNRKCSMQTME